MPIVGSWYDGSIREALGKIVLTGSSIIDGLKSIILIPLATGILNYVPTYVESAINAAYTTGNTITGVAGDAMAVGHSLLDSTGSRVAYVGLGVANATGVSSLLSSVSGVAGSAVTSVSDAAGSAVESATDSAVLVMEFAKQTAFIVKLKAAQYVEVHSGKVVVAEKCYSPTCVPGVRCYSPSCFRNKPGM
jgi:hypothetical protein